MLVRVGVVGKVLVFCIRKSRLRRSEAASVSVSAHGRQHSSKMLLQKITRLSVIDYRRHLIQYRRGTQ